MKNCIVLVVFIVVISLSGCFKDNSKTVLNVPVAGKNVAKQTAITPEVVDNLKSIEIINMNSKRNSKVNLKLPKDWYAKGYICDISKGSEYQSEKNKQIKKVYSFNIYNEESIDKFNLYGEKGVAGTFEIHGYYRDQSESSCFPNHSNVKCKLFSGMTVLGQGEIFLLNCDLPRELRTKKDTSYEVIYAWIPIDNEKLAYNLAISVPVGEKDDDYIRIVKKILKTE